MTGPNYAAQAAIKCGEALFQSFLADATPVDVTGKESAGEALRQLAGVSSRKVFNSAPGAEKWARVLKWFKMWRQGYGKDVPPFLMGQAAYRRGCDFEDNPFDPEEGPDIDKPHDFWAQGLQFEKRMIEFSSRVL